MAGKPNSVCFKAYVGRAVFFIKERRIMFKTGDIIDGRYEIKEQIGAGGGGIVYKAYHLTMKKDVAIKLIKNVHSSDLENRSEVDLMKNLKSKYFPIFYDFIESEGNVYTVMEYINGHDIKSLVEMGKKFDEATITRCGIQLCCAAQELHSQCPPIIHGDIKPANVMLTLADNICLIDFNISSVMQGGKAAVKGYSKEYSAPEQTVSDNGYRQFISEPIVDEYHEETRFLFDGEEAGTKMLLDDDIQCSGSMAYIDVQSDIYGIGAVLYYMVTGHAPANLNTDFKEINVSKKLKNIILKAMSPLPKDRFATANEMKDALESNIPVTVSQSIAADDIGDRKKSRIRPVFICAIALCISAAIFSVVIINGQKNEGTLMYKAESNVTTQTSESKEYKSEVLGEPKGLENINWGMTKKEVLSNNKKLNLYNVEKQELVYWYPKDEINNLSFGAINDCEDGAALLHYYFDYESSGESDYVIKGLYRISLLISYDSETLLESDYQKLIDKYDDKYSIYGDENDTTWLYDNNSYIETQTFVYNESEIYLMSIDIFSDDYLNVK